MLFKDLKPGRKFIYKEEADATSAVIVYIKTLIVQECCPNAVSSLGKLKRIGDDIEVIEILDGFGVHEF